jgi:hypothetical protein
MCNWARARQIDATNVLLLFFFVHRIVLHCGTLAFTIARGGLPKRFIEVADLAALELTKRRIYDVLNVLEPLGVTNRVSKGKFEWNGVAVDGATTN